MENGIQRRLMEPAPNRFRPSWKIRFGKTGIVLPIFLPNQYCHSVTLEVANEIGRPLRAGRPLPLTPLERNF
jgi:hypothetical protein